jgi:hypothetical protein
VFGFTEGGISSAIQQVLAGHELVHAEATFLEAKQNLFDKDHVFRQIRMACDIDIRQLRLA